MQSEVRQKRTEFAPLRVWGGRRTRPPKLRNRSGQNLKQSKRGPAGGGYFPACEARRDYSGPWLPYSPTSSPKSEVSTMPSKLKSADAS